ncbi:3' terminal RNA ribose 2'-O-methyltransferase Hen1 [Streptomyces sp. WAC 00631]|uniref:3' terminal RNA ribose 2'-O-methyltransferase Hen1 n=1 Tax=Streptomyces sp. WAC 00631 TaxID=2203201 RepID=UPI001E34BD52|nr:3' terminal RNA ribose 2'-O-methyltransferase Hen1 [Streptomyces sp. WAC 00631]MCC5036065.1 3' terminal RNA ribose 2'-O-methyltransferase Hen1 [Streptomyces sp. WAC 00631]
MFLTIGTTGTPDRPATDLGFLLHKHPDRAQTFSTSHGTAHVLYPEASAERCTAALLLEVDPVALVRRGRGRDRGSSPDGALAQYVNDRPYAASSLLAVALGKVFASALKGRCDARPELPGRALPLRIGVPALSARGGPALVRRLFEPLGWTVTAEPVPLDDRFPEWGDSRYVRLVLEGERQLSDALRQLYVLLPVLDDAKHYWVAPDEVDKLLRSGAGWLPDHPERELIAGRYLTRRRGLARQALERLALARLAEADDAEPEEFDNAVEDDGPEEAGPEGAGEARESGAGAGDAVRAVSASSTEARTAGRAGGPVGAGESGTGAGTRAGIGVGGHGTGGAASGAVEGAGERPPVPLAVRRREAIAAALRDCGAARVLDLGCGQGQLTAALLSDPRFTEIVGMDVSPRALQVAARRLRLERMGERQAGRVKLIQGSLAYTDTRLRGYDAAVLSEVVEHVDPPRLPALEHAVFGAARPRTVVVTTPNAEYNVRWDSLPAGRLRHHDHRFEWDRAAFRDWARQVAGRYGYEVAFAPVGPDDPEVGGPTSARPVHLARRRTGADGAAGGGPGGRGHGLRRHDPGDLRQHGPGTRRAGPGGTRRHGRPRTTTPKEATTA